MKIYTKVKGATGTWASVRFTDGVGETDNPHLIEWFRTHGYKLENDSGISTKEYDVGTPEPESTDEIDLESMSPNQLREYAVKIGKGGEIKNIRNKQKLLNIIRG